MSSGDKGQWREKYSPLGPGMALPASALPALVSVFPPRRSSGGGLVAKLCPTLETPWAVARQAPLSVGFPRQEYWSGLPFLSPGDLPNPGIKFLHWQPDSLPPSHQGSPKPLCKHNTYPTEMLGEEKEIMCVKCLGRCWTQGYWSTNSSVIKLVFRLRQSQSWVPFPVLKRKLAGYHLGSARKSIQTYSQVCSACGVLPTKPTTEPSLVLYAFMALGQLVKPFHMPCLI